jgi:hypothetical protein
MTKRSSKLPLLLLLLFTIVALVIDMSCETSRSCPTCMGSSKPAYYNKERVKAAKNMALKDKKRSATGEKRTNRSADKEEVSKKPSLLPKP